MTGGEYYRATVEAVRAKGNWFKATQPDGFSFMGSPQKLYAVGATVAPNMLDTVLCEPGLLHVSDTPSETLAGGQWPCRLFEVSGEIVAGFNDEHPHKGGSHSLTVVRELPAWMALGPNGRAAAAFIELLPTLDSAAWAAAAACDAAAAWAAARDAAWAAARDAAVHAARDAAVHAAWAAAVHAAWAAAWDAAWDAAWYAAGDAARAIIVADLITPKQFAVLYTPFAEVLPIERVREHSIAIWPLEGGFE